jgi:RHS repeat-associated protein
LATYTFSVNSKTDAGTLTWNPNGTLAKLVINDQIPSTTDSQTCTYGYDDVQRLSNVTCGTFWVQNFTYDPFGNITKNVPNGDGGLQFLPSYWTSPPTNQFTSLPGATVHYDANGNLLTDNLNTYTWDPNWGTMTTVSTGSTTVTATYDALGRMVENNAGGSYSEFVYGPTGTKLAKVNGTTLVKAFIALPGGAKAIYNSSGTLAYYRHSDWLGSSRLTSTQARGLYSSSAYAPFGEQYATSGSADASFTGQDQDTVSNLYDFPARRQSPSQGRWISPDPAGRRAVTLGNPQSWNRYTYVNNNPLALIDPTGMDDCESSNAQHAGAHPNDDCSDDDDDDGGGGGGGGDDNSGDDNSGDNGNDANDGSKPCSVNVAIGATTGISDAQLSGIENSVSQYFQVQAGLSVTFDPLSDRDVDLMFVNDKNKPFDMSSAISGDTFFFPDSTDESYVNVQFLSHSMATAGPGSSLLQGILWTTEHELTHAFSGGSVQDNATNDDFGLMAEGSDASFQTPSPDLSYTAVTLVQDVNDCPLQGDVGGNQGPMAPPPDVPAIVRRIGH